VTQNLRLGCAFYRTQSGPEPVRDWLRGLGKEVSKTIGSDILTVQCSWPVGKTPGRWPGRRVVTRFAATHERAEYRVFFCIAASNLVLLHEIVKKARKAPKADVELARKRLREVIAR
jgi:phage-related protein